MNDLGITTGRVSDLLWLMLRIYRNTEKILTAQEDINAAVAAQTALLTDLQAQTAQLATDLATLTTELQGQGVDTTALNAVTAQVAGIQSALDAGVSAITSLATPPPPPPPPTPAPTPGV